MKGISRCVTHKITVDENGIETWTPHSYLNDITQALDAKDTEWKEKVEMVVRAGRKMFCIDENCDETDCKYCGKFVAAARSASGEGGNKPV